METNNEKVEEKTELKAAVKPEAKKEETKVESTDTVNILSAVSSLFGMPATRVQEMIGLGSIHIDSERWLPDGNFDIPLSSIEGKMIEIVSQPTSIKFTFNSEDINEYRTSTIK